MYSQTVNSGNKENTKRNRYCPAANDIGKLEDVTTTAEKKKVENDNWPMLYRSRILARASQLQDLSKV